MKDSSSWEMWLVVFFIIYSGRLFRGNVNRIFFILHEFLFQNHFLFEILKVKLTKILSLKERKLKKVIKLPSISYYVLRLVAIFVYKFHTLNVLTIARQK